MRFADRSVYATRTAFDRFHLELDTPEERAAALERRHFITSAVVTIATQPDPDVALLDMIVLVTLERMGAERLWLPTVFGEAGRPYLEALVTLEESIWALGQRVMTPPQLQELRAIVADWENSPPDFFRRASFFRQSRVSAGRVRSAGAGVNRSRGLFASVRSAASSADDLMLQVERLIFLLQRMPDVVGAQAEYQVSKLGRAPEVAGTLEEVSGALAALGPLAELADRLGPAAEGLGVLLGDETTDLEHVLESGDERIRGLLGEVRATAEAGNELVAALNTTVERATDLATGLELPIEHLDALRSEEMRASLAEVTATVSHLEAVVAGAERLLGARGLEQAASGLEAAMEKAGGVGEGLIDRAYVAGAKLILIFLVGLLVTLLAYRYLAGRMATTAATREGPAA